MTDDREPYETPEVREQSPEEMLAEAQQAVDQVFDRFNEVEAKVDDMTAAISHVTEELEELQTALSSAEAKVQRIAYVAKVRGEQEDADTGGA